MPRDLREMIARQIDRLPPEEQRLLEVASAIGVEFSAAAVAGGMNRDAGDVEEACAELAQKGHVLSADGVAEWPDGTVSGRFSFLHAFYQEVLYKRLAPGRRANLHRKLGDVLERGYRFADVGNRGGARAPFRRGARFRKGCALSRRGGR